MIIPTFLSESPHRTNLSGQPERRTDGHMMQLHDASGGIKIEFWQNIHMY